MLWRRQGAINGVVVDVSTVDGSCGSAALYINVCTYTNKFAIPKYICVCQCSSMYVMYVVVQLASNLATTESKTACH